VANNWEGERSHLSPDLKDRIKVLAVRMQQELQVGESTATTSISFATVHSAMGAHAQRAMLCRSLLPRLRLNIHHLPLPLPVGLVLLLHLHKEQHRRHLRRSNKVYNLVPDMEKISHQLAVLSSLNTSTGYFVHC
jgi:hypothetical protein